MEKPGTDQSRETSREARGEDKTAGGIAVVDTVATSPAPRHNGVTSSRVGVVGEARPTRAELIAAELIAKDTVKTVTPGQPATDPDGTDGVREQLLLMQSALARLSADSEAQIASLRRDLEAAVHGPLPVAPVEEEAEAQTAEAEHAPEAVKRWTAYELEPDRERMESEARAHLRIPLLVSAAFAVVACGLALYLQTPTAPPVEKPPVQKSTEKVEIHPPAPGPPATQTVSGPAVPAGGARIVSAEQRAMERLDDALAPVPAAAMPSLMNSANQWLGESGLPPCTLASPRGDSSMVITSGRKPGPLVAALSSCADAIEHFTGR